MRFELDFPSYNASIYLRTESSEREKWVGPIQKKFCELMILSAKSVRIAIDFDAS